MQVLGQSTVEKYMADLVRTWPKLVLDTEADVRKAVTRTKRLLFDFCVLYSLRQANRSPQEAAHERSEQIMESLLADYKEHCLFKILQLQSDPDFMKCQDLVGRMQHFEKFVKTHPLKADSDGIRIIETVYAKLEEL